MSGEYTRALQDIHVKLDWLLEMQTKRLGCKYNQSTPESTARVAMDGDIYPMAEAMNREGGRWPMMSPYFWEDENRWKNSINHTNRG